jgi:hypothetical protein
MRLVQVAMFPVELRARLIKVFLAEAPERLADLRHAIATEDPCALGSAATA